MVNPVHKILEINLATEQLPSQLSKEDNHYVLLWWNKIPIAHWFVSSQNQLSQNDILVKCIDLVLKSIEKESKAKFDQTIIEVPDTEQGLKEVCGKLYGFESKNVPATCPVSVVICTRDRPEFLESCLTFLMKQECKPTEIIVVDNASVTNRTKEVASKFEVTYVREDRPGLDIARNTGAYLATNDIIAYTDDDTKPVSNWVHEVYSTFIDSSVQAMTGLVLAAELNSEAQLIFEKHWPFNRGFNYIRFNKAYFTSTLRMGPPVWNIGAGANMAFRKSILNKVGYFDERLDVGAAGCSGDSELWYRILANGFDIQYNPRAVVYHFHRASMTGLHEQLKSYMKGFTVAILIQYQQFKHTGNLRHLFISTPKYYIYLLLRGFPFYRFRFRTLFSEIIGVFSGLIFYMKHRNTNSNIFSKK